MFQKISNQPPAPFLRNQLHVFDQVRHLLSHHGEAHNQPFDDQDDQDDGDQDDQDVKDDQIDLDDQDDEDDQDVNDDQNDQDDGYDGIHPKYLRRFYL